MVDIRAQAMKLINEVGPSEVVLSNDTTPFRDKSNKFEYLTGYSQKKLTDDRKAIPGLTTCFGLVNMYSDRLRYMVNVIARPKLGNITPGLKGYLESEGYGHAFVPADQGSVPYPGDVLQHKKQHIDVVATIDGTSMTCFAGGQGEKGSAVDAVKRYPATFDPGNYVGWCDIEILYGPKPSKKVIPDWLIGHYFEITWRGTDYYYYFDTGGKVVWCDYEHADWTNYGWPLVDGGLGRYIYDDNAFNTKVTIYWNSGTVEVFTRRYPAPGVEYLDGVWNWSEPMRATQLT